MKKLLPLILALIFVITIITPVAADKPLPTGEQISLFSDVEFITYPANTPFHIKHGFLAGPRGDEECQKPPTYQWGVSDFQLEMDGKYLSHELVEQLTVPCKGPVIHGRWWVYNFPNGLTGIHQFTGHWILGCKAAIESGYIPGPCDGMGEEVEILNKTLTIEFIEP